MKRGVRTRIVWMAGWLAVATAASAAPPTRGEFQVNAITAGDQAYPAACVDRQGRATVVWESRGEDGAGNAVITNRFDRDDAPLGGEVIVNATTAGDQQAPAVACTPDGAYVVVWEGRGQDGDDFGVAARRFDAGGAPQGGELAVNTHTAGRQRAAATCYDAAGNFVVAWQSDGQDGDGYGVFAQRFAADGARRGDELAINQTTAASQSHPALACAPGGEFVVVWQSREQDGDGEGIYARRIGADAVAGDETRVNAVTTGNQQHPAVAALPGGGFVVVWESRDGQDGDGAGVFARRLGDDGQPAGDERSIAAVTAFHQEQPAVAATRNGFLAAWSSYSDGDDVGVFARRFDAAGQPLSGEFPVNTTIAGVQGALSDEPHPIAVAAGVAGDLLLAWHSTRLRGTAQDGDGFGVFARSAALAPGCPGDCSGDGAVMIDELLVGVGLALRGDGVSACVAVDTDGDAHVSVAELIAAVAAALNGCPPNPEA